MVVLRSSSADRTFSCHGSLTAAPFIKERTDSRESQEGELIHYMIARRLVLELGATEPEGGLVAPNLPPDFKLTPFSSWIVDWAVELVRSEVPADWSLMVELPIAYEYALPRPVWIPAKELNGPIPEGAITRVRPDGETEVLVDRFILSGHMDWFALSPDGTESMAGDWKAGAVGTDPAENNWQVGCYLGLGKKGWPELVKSRFILAQPKIDEEATGIPRISRTTLNGPELDAMNLTLAEQMNQALEDRFTTDSSMKACRWCPVAIVRPWDCPSLQAEKEFMKAKLTDDWLERLRSEPNDGLLGDFVVSGRVLTAPIKAATELLHERLDKAGFVDAAGGTRITRTTRPGSYEVADPAAFNKKAEEVLPSPERRALCYSWSMTELKDQIAADRGIHKNSKKGVSAADVFDAEFRATGLVTQKESRILIFQ